MVSASQLLETLAHLGVVLETEHPVEQQHPFRGQLGPAPLEVHACHLEMDRRGARRVDLRPDAMAAWSAEMRRKAAGTVWNTGGCASWYLDDEGRNTVVWPDQTYRFVRRTKRFDAGNYELR